ncbi:tryptophan-rich sensory protein [Pedobacter changchengzhani]|uniref:Tryptophan-rich sensory protein n=1 Tax=Pedobacter changchengzhani TaxID=2529274 RepID=A0A4V3A046_9SPHI|nr:tryptophan-rich sensory protein [Pedobacter changchengzhani]TDG36193.1 tryptophan-rich sensory protein [Pedobacter changchengzhani]
MKKIFAICNLLALIATIVINYLSNTGVFNGNTMKTVSDKYFNYFTPAGYAFSIWGLIYLLLICFVVYTGRVLFNKTADETLSKIGWWFVLSCLGNSLWVVAWLYDYTGLSVLIMLVMLVALVKIVTNISVQTASLKHYVFVYLPFAIYLGWISVALVACVSAYLTKINWAGFGISKIDWAIVMVLIAGLINILMISCKNIKEFGMVGIWALIAIGVSNTQERAPIAFVYLCYLVAGILALAIIIGFFKRKRVDI